MIISSLHDAIRLEVQRLVSCFHCANFRPRVFSPDHNLPNLSAGQQMVTKPTLTLHDDLEERASAMRLEGPGTSSTVGLYTAHSDNKSLNPLLKYVYHVPE